MEPTTAGDAPVQHAHQVFVMAEPIPEVVADAVRDAALDYVEAGSSEQLWMLRQGGWTHAWSASYRRTITSPGSCARNLSALRCSPDTS